MRRRRSNAGDELTLFPFLAVLICTVGSLIVLLVVMMQQAKATAADRSRERTPQQPVASDEAEQIQSQVEALQWRIEVLSESRQKTVEDLKARETELSYIEDEVRQLRARLDRAAAEAAHIQQLAAQKDSQRQASAAQLAQLRERLERSHEALELARQAFKQGERSYALIPYNGSNGTRRKPLYIECTGDRVILQPEGVELYSDDFREPLTDDNPLAAALRAQREYFADATLDRQEPPYPLIIVRPDGSHAYAAARAAMEAWDAEFGYELVDDDMKLAYPPVDAALVDVVREAVEEARARRRLLQSIAPARFGRREPVLTASRSGGFVRQGTADDEGPSVGRPVGQRLPDARRNGQAPLTAGARRNEPSASRESGEHGSGLGGGSEPRAGLAGNSERSSSDSAAPSRQAVASTANGSWGDASGSEGPAARQQSRTTTDNELPSSATGAGTRPLQEQQGRQVAVGRQAARAGDTAGSAGSASAMSAASSGRERAASAAAGAAGASAGGSIDFSASPPSLENARGADWALPERAEGATAITRPIRVSCYADHLVIFPEKGQGKTPIVVPTKGQLREEVDELVSKVWERIDSWGIAGSRMYWRPVLEVHVQKGADQRYAELAQLLEGSGIVVTKQ